MKIIFTVEIAVMSIVLYYYLTFMINFPNKIIIDGNLNQDDEKSTFLYPSHSDLAEIWHRGNIRQKKRHVYYGKNFFLFSLDIG